MRKFKKHSVLSRVFSDHAYGSAVSARVRQFKPDIVMSANTPLDAQKLLVQAAHNADATRPFFATGEEPLEILGASLLAPSQPAH